MSNRIINFSDGFSSASQPSGVDGISKWITAKIYVVDDIVVHGSQIYGCLVAHTSGTFATDLVANKWVEISQGVIDHGSLTSIGTNTHAQIDTYIATTAPSYVDSQSIINALIFG